jgi:hypothetical protein
LLVRVCWAPASRTVADHTAEARTEAARTGAAGDTRTAAVLTKAVAGRTAPVAAATLARVGRAGAGIPLAEAVEAAVDLAEGGGRACRRWRGPVVGDRLEAERTAGLRARRADIRPVAMAGEVTAGRVAVTPATTLAIIGPDTRTAVMAEAPGTPADPVTAVVEATAVTPAPMAVLGRAEGTGTLTEIQAAGAAVMERRQIAAIPE